MSNIFLPCNECRLYPGDLRQIRLLILLVSVALVTLVLSGCGDSSDSPPTTQANAKVHQLVRLLEDSDIDKRIEAAKELGQIGPPAKLAIPALIRALKNRNTSLSNSASKALSRIGEEAARALVQEADITL